MPTTLHLDANLHADLLRAADILRAGELVAFATETVYGLGANALSAEAVARIFEAKQRPAWDPLIVHIASASQLSDITEIPAEFALRVSHLAEAFWPGPLTLLLPRNASVPDAVTGRCQGAGVTFRAGTSFGCPATHCGSQRQPLWPHKSDDGRPRADRPKRPNRGSAGRWTYAHRP
jgi:hypothetical protein